MSKKRRLITGLGRVVLGVFAPQIAKIIQSPIEYLTKFINDSYEKNAELTSKLVVAVYPFVDTIVEDYCKKTKSTKDDEYVSQALRVLEAFAADKGLILDNLDED